MADRVTLTYQDRIAIITFNRPEVLNALDADCYYLLGERLREIDKREDIYITVLTGSGRFFSAGADIRGDGIKRRVDTSLSEGEQRREIMRTFLVNNLDLTRTVYNHSKILVVALNGPVVGLTAAVISFADFIYAAPHTYLLTPFSSLGLVAEGGASQGFVQRLGISKANEALLMSKRISCEELVATGFVNKVISAPSGKKEDSDGFLKVVLAEIDDKLGLHLNQSSLLGIKRLIRQPDREALDRANMLEVFGGVDRFVAGIPQEEFRKLAAGEKKHKL
ncbi:dodecenoyl-CoA isomerase [Talaromyces marneffei ATCC 18224]|uniref:Peroxisomal D3,D2-enoyl-CoA isomerase n=3 Tax=Talaromyces marneffei TaxID=37727 RepID=B6Q2F0_TALMQ|nr:uncharacterized protein EYB26_000271 [Talaromyces marneffei]EEA26907.1 peroxisomal D3,D2-enoyl-CoA isomerase [Talaromyces marneffei ATCC 18224]EEA26908.1 peroxisomal D3,D2-enoyl-CoA isomerase [Talaromyces marneffei ATCC 18224]EEA26909.1 peroxisomal D3,D2-enoyl-CoA isomerase [Talaromyces marneffei ATCC 18224]KAE8557356.1 hypothetical protein EYB25_002063 [Talaromyces marneffei]QGA12627.1 hypothetical protein EYB26_000271 [Talaromyces marneffei]